MNVYALIIPIVLLLLLAEIIVTWRLQNGKYPFQDTITNLGTGIANQCVNLAVAFLVYKWYGWLHELTPLHIELTWYTGILLLLLQDFVFYWFHRLGHTINIFWAAHMPHHSSEEMNLSVGIRASFTQRLFQFMFFDWILVMIGFTPEAVYSIAGIHLLLAYWHHTAYIRKLGWFEKFFVTPSHHRVHHGVNPQYLDKNYSEFLIVWDKWFGSFEPEVEEVCYGVTHPPRTWDPMAINFQFWKQLWDDAVAAPYLWDKFRIWFMPLGWRPRGLPPYQNKGYSKSKQVKYQSTPMLNANSYLIAQVIFSLVILFLTVNLNFPIAADLRIALSITIFLTVVSWGAILEAKKWAVPLEIVRSLVTGVALTYALHQSGIAHYASWTTIVISLSVGFNVFFSTFLLRKPLQKAI